MHIQSNVKKNTNKVFYTHLLVQWYTYINQNWSLISFFQISGTFQCYTLATFEW
jgi:hypothetical protein